MHIKTAESVGRTVSWFLLDKSTAHRLFGVSQTDVQKEATRWHAIVCRITKEGSAPFEGVAWTSKKDDFAVGTGMRLALERALASGGYNKEERSSFWDIVSRDEDASKLITDVEYGQKWAASAQRTMFRRARSIAPSVEYLVGGSD